MAVTGDHEVGILMSTDTDLKPALKAVATLAHGQITPRAEAAAWSCNALRRRISTGGKQALPPLA